MNNVILYGTISVLPLIFGALIGAKLRVKEKVIGVVSAFGAGALIAALTFGLMEESFKLGGFDNSITGFLLGGIFFVIGELFIIRAGGRGHKRSYVVKSTTGYGIVLGAVLDGLPESIALGISLLLNPKIGFLVLLAIIFSNLPEALSSAYDLKRNNKSFKSIILTWVFVALAGLICVILGYTVFSNFSSSVTATFEAIAAGGILAMLATTMMPEAYKESGIDASLATVLGFLLIFILSKASI
ncbi:MAG: Zinc/iron permease [Berkelbacteria bacterium GW2011_GWB1_38_5]|uniref:Zinc/iron permease n=2 Tax=Candidatus Berkelbacteria TaxID=1618330 RepID=A0A0G0LRW9_9BACT|nr:MAG: Zinc/iron permease [Berkelbacteria bacterium GW2011_GWB1_38_5]KKQ90715.1 MAG: Zinc/iron permease [Berkelbacteria bacterium GW2011_GWA1_39_10]